MGLASALNTSWTGVSLSSTEINVLGNNIANAATTGFKQSNIAFATLLSQTLSAGSKQTSTNAGTNPLQSGFGGAVAAVTPDFTQGSIALSNSPSNLAIQGNGFFVVQDNTGTGQLYTRDGTFGLTSANQLTTSNGQNVLGYGVDNNFNIVAGGLTPLQIPLGTLQEAQQTKTIQMAGALSPQGQIATQGTTQTSVALTDQSTSAAAGAGTLLTNLLQPASATPTTPLFALGQTITFAPTKGGQTLTAKSLTVTGGSTVSDLESFISDTLGLQTGGAVPVDADGVPVGVSINASGQLVVKGNRGTVNDINLPVGSLTVDGSSVPISFAAGANRANGESATTTFKIYDSTGTPLDVRMSSYLESESQNGTVYRYMLESADQSGPAIAIGNGTVTFDSQGKVSSPPTAQFTIDRSGTAAVNPMQVTLDVSQISGLTLPGSNLNLSNQDGAPTGTLSSYNISDSGVINGTFSNGLVRTLGQVALAQFTNTQGLVQVGNNDFAQGMDSGPPTVTAAGVAGAGTLRAGALEQSNANLGKDLINLVNASAMYQENARAISSNQQLFSELLTLRN